MTALPRVSIIIPSHDAERLVGETIAAALAQRHDAFEVIVVDDGSTDATVACIAGFADPRLRLVEQANAGAAAARNHGLAVARGRYVLFLDADDLIPPGHLSALETAMAGSDAHVAFGQWDRFRDDPAEGAFPPRPGYRDAAPADWLVEDWRYGNPMTQCGTFLIPRALLDRLGGWNEQLSLIDDFEFFARILCGSAGLRHAPAARVFYRSGVSGSLSTFHSARGVRSAFDSYRLGTGHLLALEDTPRTRRAAANILQHFDHAYYPGHPALRAAMRTRVADLGGADIAPEGPPWFHRLRHIVGWRAARRVQLLATRLRGQSDYRQGAIT